MHDNEPVIRNKTFKVFHSYSLTPSSPFHRCTLCPTNATRCQQCHIIRHYSIYTKLPSTMTDPYFSLFFAGYSNILLSFNKAFPLAWLTYLFQYALLTNSVRDEYDGSAAAVDEKNATDVKYLGFYKAFDRSPQLPSLSARESWI